MNDPLKCTHVQWILKTNTFPTLSGLLILSVYLVKKTGHGSSSFVKKNGRQYTMCYI